MRGRGGRFLLLLPRDYPSATGFRGRMGRQDGRRMFDDGRGAERAHQMRISLHGAAGEAPRE